MTISCLAGAFNTGTGAVSSTIDVTGSITISGASAVILFTSGRTEATDTVGRATRYRAVGFAVSSSDRRSQMSVSGDALGAADGGSYHTDAAALVSCDLAGAIDGALDFDSWLSNGFRLIVDDVMPRDYRVGYLIITGLDNAATGQWQDQAATGNFAVTTGLSFQPTCEIMFASVINTAPPSSRGISSVLGFGFAVSTTERATWCGGTDEGSPSMDTDSYCLDLECLSSMPSTLGTSVDDRLDFVSHNSNGFTLNQLEVPGSISYNHFLALRGGSYAVRSVTTQTDTTTDITTSVLGFDPAGVLAISAFKAEHAQNVPNVHDTGSFGAASGTGARVAMAWRDEDGVADSIVSTAVEHDEIYASITATAIEGLMDVKTFADPLVFIMDDADPSAKFVTMLVVGNALAAKTRPMLIARPDVPVRALRI